MFAVIEWVKVAPGADRQAPVIERSWQAKLETITFKDVMPAPLPASCTSSPNSASSRASKPAEELTQLTTGSGRALEPTGAAPSSQARGVGGEAPPSVARTPVPSEVSVTLLPPTRGPPG